VLKWGEYLGFASAHVTQGKLSDSHQRTFNN